MIEDYLNVRYSLRNISDQDFENILPTLASELEQVSFIPKYDDGTLHKEWKKLCSWKTNATTINSTSRVGLKLCEHFFPNFYDIEMKNKSFSTLWKAENLEKVLRWNRKSHSTPYLSELKRGIYFCLGLTKNTMYRPQMAKLICDTYKPKLVLDPCAGWGGRMLGVVASGAHYYAFEPNTQTYNNLNSLAQFLGIEKSVTLIHDDALTMSRYNIPKVDLVLTSPPYYDLEVYCKENTQSITNYNSYQNWSNGWYKQLIKICTDHINNGYSCWNVARVGANDMSADLVNHHNLFGYKQFTQFEVVSSKRQAINKTGKDKSQDITVVFKA
jgi:16S rRNA G966 N2-methylase RsmD